MKSKFIFVVSGVLMALALTAYADITVKSDVQNEGMGGFTNMQGTQTVMVSGEKSKTATQMKMTNKVVGFLGGGKPQEMADITRLDKELCWHLDMNDKKYTELTFAEMKVMFEKGLQEAQSEKGKGDDQDSIQFKADVKVDATGKSQTIAGYKADEVIISMAFKGTDKESGKSGTMNMIIDMWMSKDVPGYQEYQNFNKTLAEKLGFSGQAQGSMDQALKGFGVDAKVVYEKMKGVEGMPLLTVVSIMPEGVDTLVAKAMDSEKAAKPGEQEVQEPETQSSKDMALKKLGGLFGKKKDKGNKESAKAEPKQGGSPYLFHITTTVTQITGSDISATEFEVPQGFKKKSE